MRLWFPQLHERERKPFDHATCPEQRHGEQRGVCLGHQWHGLWHRLAGVLGTTTRTTTYVSTSKVTANITDADIMNAGMVQVYVHSGGANSNAITFTIQ